MDKELLEKKKQLQKAKNIFAKLSGLELLNLEEMSLYELISEDQYLCKAHPNSCISFDVDVADIVNWMKDNMPFRDGSEVFLIINSYCLHVRICNIKEAYTSIWDTLGSALFVSIDKKKMYEFGADSRDEYNYLFDEFDLQ